MTIHANSESSTYFQMGVPTGEHPKSVDSLKIFFSDTC